MTLPGRSVAFTAGLLLVATVAGCGAQRPEGTLSGQVTYRGQPVTEGEIQFFSKQGSGATAQIHPSGHFTVDGPLLVGDYEVCVVPEVLHPTPGIPRPTKKSPDIPRKARDMKTSGLTVYVKEGKNETTFELRD